MKNLEVQIMGQNYVLGCPENSEERLLQAVERVDAAMCKVRDAGRIKARDRIAVLVALNLSFKLLEPAFAASTPEPDPSGAASGESHAQLQALLQRLDGALGAADIRQQ